ncbi:nucleoid-associated protein [Nonlabens marinus]|uniref:Lmo0572 protein n=1 Tax=Nonlabens marinus S1-08 TaxID=1454201 RepID=W8VXW1_9FLAO|nr:nucleoid-associated protein [Nonlabens marinus]BAO56617.1 lmo0572 protein [Nonlabens marinus S1-08]
MINLYNTRIEDLAIHRVGNKNKGEMLLTSSSSTPLDDEMHSLLKEYFLKPFRSKEEAYYSFHHEEDLEFHEMFAFAKAIFSTPATLLENSKKIAKQLYQQSVHPHIRSGEVYVCHFTNVMLDNNKTDAIGIFKSEIKQDFLQFEETESDLKMILKQGVNLNKLDKGAIIFNVEQENGFKILSVDSNRYDAKYWLDDFLGVDVFEDENFFTKKYLKFCQDFAKDVVLPAEDKKEEVMFMNRAVNHFAKNDSFEESAFLNDTFENPDLIPEFKHYKTEKGPKYSIEDVSSFPISNTAVSAARKGIKSVINLDTHVQIKMDFTNSDSAEKFIEKGWDEERQMYYYLVYFNREEKK